LKTKGHLSDRSSGATGRDRRQCHAGTHREDMTQSQGALRSNFLEGLQVGGKRRGSNISRAIRPRAATSAIRTIWGRRRERTRGCERLTRQPTATGKECRGGRRLSISIEDTTPPSGRSGQFSANGAEMVLPSGNYEFCAGRPPVVLTGLP
jgi:hypothetical protein